MGNSCPGLSRQNREQEASAPAPLLSCWAQIKFCRQDLEGRQNAAITVGVAHQLRDRAGLKSLDSFKPPDQSRLNQGCPTLSCPPTSSPGCLLRLAIVKRTAAPRAAWRSGRVFGPEWALALAHTTATLLLLRAGRGRPACAGPGELRWRRPRYTASSSTPRHVARPRWRGWRARGRRWCCFASALPTIPLLALWKLWLQRWQPCSARWVGAGVVGSQVRRARTQCWPAGQFES